jgi:hypothetical protein
MPKQLQQYLRSKKLPLPHGNSTNWFLAIYQGFEQSPRLKLPRPVKDELELDAADIKEGLSLASADQATLERDARYKTTSRYGMVLSAAIEKRDPSLLDMNPNKVVAIYADYRRSNPHLVPLLVKRRDDTKAAEQKAEEERLRLAEEAKAKLAETGAGDAEGDTSGDASAEGGDTVLRADAGEGGEPSLTHEYGPERLPGTSDGTEPSQPNGEGQPGEGEPETPPASPPVAPVCSDEVIAHEDGATEESPLKTHEAVDTGVYYLPDPTTQMLVVASGILFDAMPDSGWIKARVRYHKEDGALKADGIEVNFNDTEAA